MRPSARGHRFGAPAKDPGEISWEEDRSIRFLSDDDPEADIHFKHADDRMTPVPLLLKAASYPLPDRQ